MSSEKRTLFAILLSGVVFVVYYLFFFKPPPPPSNPQVLQNEKAETQQAGETRASQTQPNTQKPSAPLPPEKTLSIENPLYKVEQSNYGGALKSFALKHYREKAEKNSPLVNLFPKKTDQNFTVQFSQANFELPPLLPFEITKQEQEAVELQWKGSELKLTQRVEWSSQNYIAQVRITLENTTSRNLEVAPGFRIETTQNPTTPSGGLGFLKGPENLIYPLTYQENSVHRHQDVKKLASRTEETGKIQWIALEDRYFLWGIVSRVLSSETRVRYGHQDNSLLFVELNYPKESIAPGGKIEKEFTLYIGPKEMERLKTLNVHLEEAVDYGWFSIVAHPILWLLKFFYKGVGNWGVAIILLTLFIKLILHPINKKSLDSMKAMQKIQPKLAEIREKYKDDRERLNTEMMGLFKTHKVNPMGGCLPMLLQMPVYIALYKVLYNAIEIYHAPFFGFYKDLSSPDPYFVLPILLGIFMVLQQKLTPTVQDPAQAKAMMFMPIIFSAFMLFLPVGLVIYIFVNTFMTVVQQYLHQKEISVLDLLRGKTKKTKS